MRVLFREDTTMYRPLDPSLNSAILTIAGRLFPDGFSISTDAPQTYHQLTSLLDSGKGLIVWSGSSEMTIYAAPEVNYAFRAWHDWCHWRGQHPFTLKGESAVYEMQCSHLTSMSNDQDTIRRWRRILYAEIMGQNIYRDRYGQFPEDQRAFVEAFLNDDPRFPSFSS